MARRQICERAVFDGGFDDPRVLTYYYQQRLRARLLAQTTREATPVARRVLAFNPLATLTEAIRASAAPLLTAPVATPRLRVAAQLG